MNKVKKVSGLTLATAAATLLLAGCGEEAGKAGDKAVDAAAAGAEAGAAKVAMIHCAGINACKGKSACKTAESACAGQNACKGKGWIELSKADCDTKGGTVSGG